MTEKPEHKQGCDALGGYGQGVGPCSCGAAGLLVGDVLPVVAWYRTVNGFEAGISWEQHRPDIPNWQEFGLAKHAPAQATIAAQAAEIERLKRERDHSPRYGPLWRKLRAEIEALKTKQVADIDEVMRLVEAYAKASSDLDESYRSRSRSPRLVNRHDLRVHVAYKAAREALRSHLAKDRT